MLGSNEASAHVTFFRDAMGFGGKIFFLPNKSVQQNTGNALHPPAPTLDHKSTYSYLCILNLDNKIFGKIHFRSVLLPFPLPLSTILFMSILFMSILFMSWKQMKE